MECLNEILQVSHKEVCCGIKEIHRSIDADTHIHIVFHRQSNHIVHIFEGVPWRETEHQRNGNLTFQGFNHLYHLVVTIASSHCFVCVFVAIQRHIQMGRMIQPYEIYDFVRSKTVGQQCIVRMVVHKPLHDGFSFGMKKKLSTLQSYNCIFVIHLLFIIFLSPLRTDAFLAFAI